MPQSGGLQAVREPATDWLGSRLLQTIVLRAPFGRLLRLTDPRHPVREPRVLLVAPHSGLRPAALYDFVLGMAPACDFHLLDWCDAADVPAACGSFGPADGIGILFEALRSLGGPLHLLGLCQSASSALAAAALLAEDDGGAGLRSLVLIGGKLDPRIAPTRADLFALDHSLDWFDRNAVDVVPAWRRGSGRRVYPSRQQAAVFLAYLGRHMPSGGELLFKMLFDDGSDALRHPFMPALMSMIDLPAEFFLGTIADVFQNFLLPRGRLEWQGHRVAPRAIGHAALLTIEGACDDIAGLGQTRVAHDLCGSIPPGRRDHYIVPGTGHFGLFHGRTCRTAILPRIQAFVAAHA